MGSFEANSTPLCAINAAMKHHPKLVGAAGLALICGALAVSSSHPSAQARPAAPKQKIDAEYTAKIKEYT